MDRIKSDRILHPDGLMQGYVYYENGRITEVSGRELPFEKQYDAMGYFVSPGFIDTHTHGGGGYSFDGTREDAVKAADFHLKHGTTSICPTISTAPFPDIRRAVKNIASAMDESLSKANILGAHIEGPYLSMLQTGAQKGGHITPPVKEDYEDLICAFGNAIARWTYAPENDAEQAFCRYLTAHGIVPSAGHTDAVYADIQAAMDAGCHLVTHLYSCTSTVTRAHGFRRLGVIESAWLEDGIYVELIADGKHLPPELLRMIYKIKGSDRICLCTDSLLVAGLSSLPEGFADDDYILEDGVCKLKDRSAFAGSIATADRLIRVMTQDAGVTLEEAVKMLTQIPARIMGLNKGILSPGADADILIFDDDIRIRDVFVMGQHYRADEI